MENDYQKDSVNLLMAMLANNGVTPEDYAKFLESFNIDMFDNLFDDEEMDSADYDYEPMPDADQKTLKLKIQLRGVSKPPMWREVLVPAEFNFSQLHYIIQAAMSLDNCHLWEFGRVPYDNLGLTIGIPRSDSFSFGIEDCTSHADETPLTAYLAAKGDKLVYFYDFRCDWIFNVTVVDVLPRQGEVAECRKYKSELQPFESCISYIYEAIRSYYESPDKMPKSEVRELMDEIGFRNKATFDSFIEDHLIDLEFVNEELAGIPDKWEPID